MPQSAGIARKKASIAAGPPSPAAMPTMGKSSDPGIGSFSRGGVGVLGIGGGNGNGAPIVLLERRLPVRRMARRDLVVIGASAGGVLALCRLASALPARLAAPVCVVLHVGANASSLPSLLTAAGPLPAAHATSGQLLEPGRIYVAPPDHHLLVQDGWLRLTRGPKEHFTRPAIDPLFRSAALSAGPRVIGVLLTGTLGDGTAGLQAVKECGGITVVQDPADAEEPAMPGAALRAVQVDHCEPLARIGPLLQRLVGEEVPPAQAPPQRLVREHRASGGENAMDDLNSIGHTTGLTCPECGGMLWEIGGSRPPRFRCHTGHGFSADSLRDMQARAAEDALWAGVRALQEKEALLRKIAELDRSAGDDTHAGQAETEADRTRGQADQLRRLLESG
jgi:two-component system chemotaxis response regulator CheB